MIVKGNEGKHQSLVNIIHSNLNILGIYSEKNRFYNHGELDIYVPRQTIELTDDFYIEVKCNIGNEYKALKQIERALSFKECTNGFMSTYQGTYSLKELRRMIKYYKR